MSSMSWEEYAKSSISDFRAFYERLSQHSKNLIEEYKERFFYLPTIPCQIILIDFCKPYPKCIIVLHIPQGQDLETIAFLNITQEAFSSESQKEPKLLKLLGKASVKALANEVRHLVDHQMSTTDFWITSHRKIETADGFMLMVRGDQPSLSRNQVSDALIGNLRWDLNRVFKKEQRERIDKTFNDLQRNVERIPETIELKKTIMEATGKLKAQLDQTDKRLDDEISGMRILVGTSETYKEWRALVADVDRLIREHVPREVFDAKISELNNQIAAFKEIREAYNKVLAQQAEVMKQQSGFITWIKYATILLPIAVISVPIIEIIRYLLGMH